MLIDAAGGGRGDGRGVEVTVGVFSSSSMHTIEGGGGRGTARGVEVAGVVFSSSSKNTIEGVGSTDVQITEAALLPVWLVVRSFKNVAACPTARPAPTEADARHTIQLEVTPAPSK